LVTYLVDAGAAQAAAAEIAGRIAAKPPIAVRMIKRGVNAYANALARAATDMDGDQFALATFTADFAEGVASFVSRRPPHYTGE
ncbi:MAG: enoyl-CoA hydratase/isomerase family protein, partial [Ferrovibrionaceae bacterium]